eukprot:365188-Chlamydomonas_euryale.AAC.2
MQSMSHPSRGITGAACAAPVLSPGSSRRPVAAAGPRSCDSQPGCWSRPAEGCCRRLSGMLELVTQVVAVYPQ